MGLRSACLKRRKNKARQKRNRQVEGKALVKRLAHLPRSQWSGAMDKMSVRELGALIGAVQEGLSEPNNGFSEAEMLEICARQNLLPEITEEIGDEAQDENATPCYDAA